MKSILSSALTNKFAIHPWSSGFRDFDPISGRLSVEHAAGLFPNGLAAAFYEMPVPSATNGTIENKVVSALVLSYFAFDTSPRGGNFLQRTYR